MKPIIIDMKDMSDSTEVYESRPNPVLAGFIYLVLAMIIIAGIWMYSSKMDIMVKGTGTVATAEENSTVTNRISGTILETCVEDGQMVKKGDVLYRISTEIQQLQLDILRKQQTDNQEKVAMLVAYEDWLNDGKEFDTTLVENLYYSEIFSRKSMVELAEESNRLSYEGEMAAYETKLDTNEEMIAYYENAVEKSKQMIDNIQKKENTFAVTDSYYRNMVDNFLVQYQHTVLQYDDTLNRYRKELTAAEDMIKELEETKSGLQSKQNPEAVLSVSGGDSVISGENLSDAVKQQLQELDTLIAAQKKVKESVEKSISDCSLQKSSALNAYEKESIVAIENSILNYQQNIKSYKGANKEYENGQETLKNQGMDLATNNRLVQEKYSVAQELENCRQIGLKLEQQILNLEQDVENAKVKATMTGVVNLASELVEGDYLSAGQQVLSIIPGTGESGFIVRSYVENKDIAKIHEGMEVTYEIAAYPSREYGTMKGKVTFVSADLKVNDNGSAYYLVETSVDVSKLHNAAGEEAVLKVGMLCETKVVVEEKRVLEILVEKLFHLGK